MAVRDGNPDPSFLPNEGEIRDALSGISVAHHLYGEQRNDAGFTEWAHAQLVEDRIDASNGIFVSAGALDAIERALIAVRAAAGRFSCRKIRIHVRPRTRAYYAA